MNDAGETYTLSEIASAVDVPMRTVQFWVDNDVLNGAADRGGKGKGTPRRLPEPELRAANLAKKLAAMNCPVSEIRHVLETVRGADPAADATRALKRIQAAQSQLVAALDGVPDFRRGDVLHSYLEAMSLCCLAGASAEGVNLFVISRTLGPDPTVLFLPLEFADLRYVTIAERGLIGLKVVPLRPDEIRFFGPLKPAVSEVYKKAFVLASTIFHDTIKMFAAKAAA